MIVLSQFESTLIQLSGRSSWTRDKSLVLMFLTPCLLSGFRNTTMGYHERNSDDPQQLGVMSARHACPSSTNRIMKHQPGLAGSVRLRSRAEQMEWQLTKLSESILTRSMICLMVWRRMIPELRWSVPASLGSLSKGRRKICFIPS